uniref:CSON000373 protein n=1 Tax=Culicoides sonorensis TaxID=179676 RepID=A0A336MRZ2_CULSO
MIFTIYYMTATIFQSWRLKTICSKISKQLSSQASVVFYKIEETDVTATPISSELCSNQQESTIQECLWYSGQQRGCSIVPCQKVYLGPWITFPKPPNLIPVNHGKGLNSILTNGKLWNTYRLESEPQPYDLLKSHSKKESLNRIYYKLNKIQWERHFEELKQLSVLANQAMEYEYNKNRTEGKTGIVKPDLISSKNIQKTLVDTKTKSSDDEIPLKTIVICENSSLNNEKANISKVQSRNESPSMMISSTKTTPEKLKTIEPPFTQYLNKNMKDNEVIIENDAKNDNALDENIHPMTSDSISLGQNSSVDSAILNQGFITNIKRIDTNTEKSKSTTLHNICRPSLKRTKKGGTIEQTKPPNILVFSESNTTKDNVINTLKTVLEKDVYTIYSLTSKDIKNKIWIDNATLLVVCGNVPKDVGKLLLDYFLHGGKMLCLCSDVLHIVLPSYRMAEVREHELVQFTYGRWKQVKMIHHIFCYQPSPVKKQFSSVDEDQQHLTKQPMQIPRYVEVKDIQGGQHKLNVQILGTEETWNTPSLMLAQNSNSGGIAIFSQIHLEIDPSNYETNGAQYNILVQNEKYRLEILGDLLKSHLGLIVSNESSRKKTSTYTNAYFLGKYDEKVRLLEKLKSSMVHNDNVIQNEKLSLKFFGKKEKLEDATEQQLPILIHSCPENFDTVKYFDFLKAKHIGRLIIYSPVVTSSMDVIQNLSLTHGFVVIPRQQTKGNGRGKNTWLSPEGCLMFSLQLHVPVDSVLGQHVSLIQHLVATAVVKSILDLPGYEDLDIRLKWPNDIYANGTTKIGGNIINSVVQNPIIICNIGLGINLSNSNPTICLNDLVKEFNILFGKNLPYLTYEYVLSIIFNEIEYLYEKIQSEGVNYFFEIYYKYWLHSEQEVTIIDRHGNDKLAKIVGIDNYGFLVVQVDGQQGTETVHPDGNSFDMLRGLILPKL